MDYRQIAKICLKLFNEARARGPRRYGAKVTPQDRSGIPNPNRSDAAPQGQRPGHGRSKIAPRKPLRTIR